MNSTNEPHVGDQCPHCGFESGTDDCTCDPWMNLPKGETRMDHLVWSIPAKDQDGEIRK